MTELWRLGAADLAGRIRAGQVSSREVVEAHLRRIEAVNPAVNAVTVVLAESALAAADAADRAVRSGAAVGPLCGVPITVKENIDVAGSATTLGIVPLAGNIARADAPHIAELRAAGAIPFARTNMPEFGTRWHTANALRGATRNPWSAAHTAGASSGGEAAALAAGMSPLGMGNDGAGSLRWPAQCCGITALKTSLGRVSLAGGPSRAQPIPFAYQLLAVHGPMARHVRDLRLGLRHMCARAGGDPWQAPAPLVGPPLATPIRVALARDPDGPVLAPELEAALQRAAEQLRDAGYSIGERRAPALLRASEIYTQIMYRWSRVQEVLPPVEGVASPEFARFWERFNPEWERARGKEAFDPMMERTTIARAWAEFMQETPLVLAPIASRPAFRVGEDLEPAWCAEWPARLRLIVVANLLGLPAVAVPTGEAGGLPQAVQIIGPRFREDLCLDAAEAIEARSPALTPVDPR
jgi:amidase